MWCVYQGCHHCATYEKRNHAQMMRPLFIQAFIYLCQKRSSNRKFYMLLRKKVFFGTSKVWMYKKENLIQPDTNCTASKGKLTIYDEFLFSLREFPNILIDPSFIGTISSIKSEQFVSESFPQWMENLGWIYVHLKCCGKTVSAAQTGNSRQVHNCRFNNFFVNFYQSLLW